MTAARSSDAELIAAIAEFRQELSQRVVSA